MNILAINGSPRKNGTTSKLLQHALNGAASQGFKTELIHLRDLDFKGCLGCFSCKLKDGKSYGKCAAKDELTPILSRIKEEDALILGSPNYIGSPSSLMKAFIERLIYPYIVYDKNWSTLFQKTLPIGFIYTMSSSEPWMKEMGYDQYPTFMINALKLYFGSADSLIVNDTNTFDDYSKYVYERTDPIEKARIARERLPEDCLKAFNLGVKLTGQE
jgi:multimeric flavodoxin WrbA